MKLFKSGDDRFKEGNDFIKRKEYDKARKSFMKAIKRGSDDSDAAEAMLALLDLEGNPSEAKYQNAYNILRKIYEKDKDSTLEFGLIVIGCSYLMVECGCMIMEKRALAMPHSDRVARAKTLFQVAENFKKFLGDSGLQILEFYKSIQVTGTEKANELMALGNEDMAESVVWEDPRKAAEYLLIALNYYKQLGDRNAEIRTEHRMKKYAKAATCWICGCEASGESIHFVTMETNVTDVLVKGKRPSASPSFENGSSVYVCIACCLAISNRADMIANEYHEAAMQEMSHMEARFEEKIREVESKMFMLEQNIEHLSRDSNR